MYIDGFVIPVPNDNKHAYRDFAAKTAPIFQDHGATRVVEGWGDDVPDGKVTDFRRAVQASEGETVVFAWIEWPDKPTRDAGMKKMREDPRMQPGTEAIPFDGKRMIFGGFDCVVDTEGL
ncbi:DUF1428 domain-containing protein [Sphingomonas koreensis]|nr:DUF1428 domain-containing protein [Sphingomonas koreensis]